KSKVTNGQVSAIRESFGFNDEWGHVPYSGYSQYHHIQLNYSGYVAGLGVTSDQIARTVVHEASHRWAGTKDVLYKHASFNKRGDVSAADRSLLQQNQMSVPGRNTPFLPMMGREKGQTNVIPPVR